MNTGRLVAALLFALFCSGALTWQLSKHLAHAPAAAASVPMRNVVLASKDLAAGEVLTTSSLSVASWPATQPLPGFFGKPQDLAGRALLVAARAGEPILTHDVADPDAPHGLAAGIPTGMRAVSLPAPVAAAASPELIMPGSHIDVLVSYRSDADNTFVSSVVLQDVRVLASNPQGTPGTEAKLRSDDGITLLLTPQEVARLTVATSLGKLTFALRNGTDKALDTNLSHVSLTPTTMGPQKTWQASVRTPSVLSHERAQMPGFTVETLSGGKSSVQTFQGSQP